MTDVAAATVPVTGRRFERVLVVEDDELIAMLVERHLRTTPDGADRPSVVVAGTLGDALRELDRDPPDVVLVDLTLPDAGIREVLDSVPDAALDSAIVVLTASPDDVMDDCLRSGAHAYLPKDELTHRSLWRSIAAALTQSER